MKKSPLNIVLIIASTISLSACSSFGGAFDSANGLPLPKPVESKDIDGPGIFSPAGGFTLFGGKKAPVKKVAPVPEKPQTVANNADSQDRLDRVEAKLDLLLKQQAAK